MKAICVHEFGPPEVMTLEDVPDLRPGPGQVVVRVKAAGVNPSDAYTRSGGYGRRPSLPFTPGSDAGGLVESVGPGVERVKAGDRVYTARTVSGAYAEQALCEEAQVRPLPENVSFSQGAGVYIPYGTAFRALFMRARLRPAETVLVHGASGGVGTAGVQLARAAGAAVIGTAGSERGRGLVRELGALHVLDHRAPDYLAQALELTSGRGVDVILEMLANVNLEKDFQVLATGGRLVVIGSRGRVEIAPRDVMWGQFAILGMTLYKTTDGEHAELFAALEAGLKNGSLSPVVGAEMSLADAPKAHHQVMEAPAYGKIVLIP
jgi:NADPH:quinone reductase